MRLSNVRVHLYKSPLARLLSTAWQTDRKFDQRMRQVVFRSHQFVLYLPAPEDALAEREVAQAMSQFFDVAVGPGRCQRIQGRPGFGHVLGFMLLTSALTGIGGSKTLIPSTKTTGTFWYFTQRS